LNISAKCHQNRCLQ